MPRAHALNSLIRRAAPLLPSRFVEQWVRLAVGEREVALCLHRVGGEADRPSALVAPARVLDELVAAAERIGRGRRWLTLTFDDGYLDAVEYAASRAPQHPEIDWRLFVCPDKTARQRGFRWDAGLDPFTDLPADEVALRAENERPELVGAGADERHPLAGLELLRQLRMDGHVAVGNHTNSHLPLAALAPDVARRELAASIAEFDRLLGTCDTFAFPFGTPGLYWQPDHAAQLREAGVQELWSVQSGTFGAGDRVPGAVLPRFPVDGRDSSRTILAMVAARATLERAGRRSAGPACATASPGPAPAPASRYRHGELLVHLAGPPADVCAEAPLVFVYGASGHVETFRHLAAVLGGSRPVYAVRASGVVAGERPVIDACEAVEAAVDAVKQLGCAVDLVGYSMGGLVAMGMAATLQPADLLAGPVRLIDTYDPALEVLPLRTRLHNARAFARRHGAALVLPWTRRLVERQLRQVLRRPARRPAWLEELGLDGGGVAGLVDLEQHHRWVFGQPATLAPYRGPVRLVRSRDLAPNLPLDAGLGGLLQGPVDVRFVAGDHFSMLSPHRVQLLLSALLH